MANQHDTKSQRHELFLFEIEGIDEYWGPTFKSIYETGEHEKFMEKLDARIKNHDKDIERMCNYHYQGFIESIRELLQVRTQVQKLKDELVEIDHDLKESTSSVLDKSTELVKARKVQNSIAAAIENLSLCLPVLKTYAKLQKQVGEKRYYLALKTLEQLEHVYLPRVANYRFSLQMRDNIPKLRENIKDAAMSDLKDFLENIRKFSPKIGEVAMRHTSEHLAVLSTTVGSKNKFKPEGSLFKGNTSYEPLAESTQNAEEDLSAQDLIDFSPVYRCLHIHTVLAVRETFEEYFRNQRKEQARLVLQPPINMNISIDSYKSYIHAIVGFFVVEEHVLNTAGTLVNRLYLDDVWSMAVPKIVETLERHTGFCTDANLLLQVKDLTVLFNITLRNYGYNINQLYDLLRGMRDHYNEVLMQRWLSVFREILDEETFSPIVLTNQQEFDEMSETFPFQIQNIHLEKFPRKLPFSFMVPKVYQRVKEYIHACLKFSEDLHLSQASTGDMIRKSTHLLLTRTFSGSLSVLFPKPGLGLLQVVQIITDIGYLEAASTSLDEFICSLTGTHIEEHSRKQAMFHVARNDAEKQIDQKLKQKIDEFLSLENYDWSLVEPQGHASSFITDLITFLQSIFSAFDNLPLELAQNSCKSACQHIAKSILKCMLSDDVKQITMGALQQINLDTIQCEQFAASEPVPGLEDGVLLQYFMELRQLLDLLMSWGWATYFKDYGQENSKYEHVDPNTAIVLLEKLSDNKNMFSVLKKSERDKKKLLDTVLKQLKQLAQTTQQQQLSETKVSDK